MTMECEIWEADHAVVYAMGPSNADEMDAWYEGLYGESIKAFSSIIHQLQKEYQKDLLLFSLVRLTEAKTPTRLYLQDRYFSMHYAEDASIHMIKRTNREWFFYRVISTEEEIPASFYEWNIQIGQIQSAVILVDQSEMNESYMNSVKSLLDQTQYQPNKPIINDDYIAVTYYSVGVDGHSITVHHGKNWPPPKLCQLNG